jgi:hypothetical protein
MIENHAPEALSGKRWRRDGADDLYAGPGEASASQRDEPVRSLLTRVRGAQTDQKAWRMGKTGELVARQLDLLPWGWRHLDAIGGETVDLDHLVIGPAGVFSLTAQHHRDGRVWVTGDRFWVNGRIQPHVRNSRDQAQQVGRLLSAGGNLPVQVTGVVVVVNAESLTVRQQPDEVHVVDHHGLRKWLVSLPRALDSRTSAEILDTADRATTWS